MTAMNWSLIKVASQLLELHERETVLGDLVEAGESAWHGLLDVLGLVARRQAGLWKGWRPWFAAFGLALPCSFLLMGFSVSISWTYRHLMNLQVFQANEPDYRLRLLLLICQVLVLIGCSWTSGFVAGALSRRTLWVSIAASCAPCLFCLARFRIESLSRLCLLLFLLPAIMGVRQGLRRGRIKLAQTTVLAAAITVLMVVTWSGSAAWFLNWALVWPAWYMVATSRRPGRDPMQLTAEEERTA